MKGFFEFIALMTYPMLVNELAEGCSAFCSPPHLNRSLPPVHQWRMPEFSHMAVQWTCIYLPGSTPSEYLENLSNIGTLTGAVLTLHVFTNTQSKGLSHSVISVIFLIFVTQTFMIFHVSLYHSTSMQPLRPSHRPGWEWLVFLDLRLCFEDAFLNVGSLDLCSIIHSTVSVWFLPFYSEDTWRVFLRLFLIDNNSFRGHSIQVRKFVDLSLVSKEMYWKQKLQTGKGPKGIGFWRVEENIGKTW